MKKVLTLLFAGLLLVPAINYAQHDGGHTFTSGDNSIEIGGYTVVYYQYRPKYTGDTKSSKNNVPTLDDARFSLRGWMKGGIAFHFEYNFAALASWLGVDPTSKAPVPGSTQSAAPTSSPKDNPVTECHVSYKIPVAQIRVKVGYMKVPYGLLNLEDKINSAFLERTKFDNGDYDPRRDVGLQLSRDFWHQRIDLTAGIFSGMGENIIYGVQDHSGKLAYVARAEFMNARYRWTEFDKTNKSMPIARLGVNVEENEKSQFSGDGYTDFVPADMNVRTIDGVKLSYGGDAAVCWHGVSLIAEFTQSKMTPHNDGNGLAVLDAHAHTTHLLSEGYYVEASYYNRTAMSGVAIRFDQLNLSKNIDLPSYNQNNRTIYFAYVFNVPKYNLQLRYHYAFRVPTKGISGPAAHWAEDEMRIGIVWQY